MKKGFILFFSCLLAAWVGFLIPDMRAKLFDSKAPASSLKGGALSPGQERLLELAKTELKTALSKMDGLRGELDEAKKQRQEQDAAFLNIRDNLLKANQEAALTQHELKLAQEEIARLKEGSIAPLSKQVEKLSGAERLKADQLEKALAEKVSLESVVESLKKDILQQNEYIDLLRQNAEKQNKALTEKEALLAAQNSRLNDLDSGKKEQEALAAQLKDSLAQRDKESVSLSEKAKALEEQLLAKGSELSRLAQEAGQREQAASQLQGNVKGLEKELSALKDQKNGLASQVTGLTTSGMKAQDELQKKTQEAAGLTQEIQRLSLKAGELEKESAALKAAAQDTQTQLRQKDQQLQQRQGELDSFRKEIAGINQEGERRVNELTELLKKNKELEAQAISLGEQKNTLMADVNQKEDLRLKAQDELSRQSALLKESEGLRQNLSSQMTIKDAALDQRYAELQQKTQENLALRKELDNLTQENKRREQELAQQQEKSKGLEEAVASLRGEKDILGGQVGVLAGLKEQGQDEIDKQAARLKELEQLANNLKAQLSGKDESLKKREAQIQQKLEESGGLQKEIVRLNQVELAPLKIKYKELEHLLGSFQDEKKALLARLDKTEAARLQAQDELWQKNQDIAALKKEFNKLSQEDLVPLQMKKEELEKEAASLNQERGALGGQVNGLTQQVKQMQEELQKKDQENALLQKELARLSVKIGDSAKESEAFKTAAAEREELLGQRSSEIEQTAKENGQLKKETEKLNLRISALEKGSEELRLAMAQKEEALAQRDAELQQKEREGARSQKEIEKLDRIGERRREQSAQLQQKNDALQSELVALRKEKNALLVQIEKLQASQGITQDELQLKAEYGNELQQQIAKIRQEELVPLQIQNKDLENLLLSFKEQKEVLQAQVDKLTVLRTQSQGEMRKKFDENEGLRQALAKADQEKELKRQGVIPLQMEKKELDDQLNSLKKKKNDLLAQVRDLEASRAQLQKELELKLSTNTELKRQIGQQNQEREQWVNELKQGQVSRATLEDELVALKKEKNALLIEIKKLESSQAISQDELQQKAQYGNELQQQIAQFRQAEIVPLQKKNQELEDELARSDEDSKELLRSLAWMQTKLSDKEKEASSLRAAVAGKDVSLSQGESELEKKLRENSALQLQVGQFSQENERKLKEYATLQAKLNGLESAAASLREERGALNDQIDKLASLRLEAQNEIQRRIRENAGLNKELHKTRLKMFDMEKELAGLKVYESETALEKKKAEELRRKVESYLAQ